MHLTVTTPTETICGHLMEGCTVRSHHSLSHFTIMVAEIEGVALNMRFDEAKEGKGAVYHELLRIPESRDR